MSSFFICSIAAMARCAPSVSGPLKPAALASFAVVAALLTIIPGMDTILVPRTAISQGRVPAFATAGGICTGTLVWGVAAAVGASALRILWFAGIIAATHFARRWLQSRVVSKVTDRIAGVVLIGFAAKIASDRN